MIHDRRADLTDDPAGVAGRYLAAVEGERGTGDLFAEEGAE